MESYDFCLYSMLCRIYIFFIVPQCVLHTNRIGVLWMFDLQEGMCLEPQIVHTLYGLANWCILLHFVCTKLPHRSIERYTQNVLSLKSVTELSIRQYCRILSAFPLTQNIELCIKLQILSRCSPDWHTQTLYAHFEHGLCESWADIPLLTWITYDFACQQFLDLYFTIYSYQCSQSCNMN